jgi:hypothetical protein
MSFNVQPQILIPLDNMQPKILTIPGFLHPAKNLSYVILPFGDAHARAYQEKIDFSLVIQITIYATLVDVNFSLVVF